MKDEEDIAADVADKIKQDTEDDDPSNMLFRAGCLLGLAAKLKDEEDREMLRKAARSLQYAAGKERT